MTTFTQDWFTRSINSWTNHLKVFKGKENVRFLEIGAFEGRATCWLLENILTADTARIVVIDTFEGSMESDAHLADTENLARRFWDNIEEYTKNKVYALIGESQFILRNLPMKEERYDFIYVDGSHIAKDVLQDIVLAWPLLKQGGIFIMDDYNWTFYEDHKLTPKAAIDTFLDLYSDEYKLLEKGLQVVVKKI